jgi:hypothetical protein
MINLMNQMVVDRRHHGSWWTTDRGVAGASAEGSPDGATWHQSSLQLKQNREERMGRC